MSDRLADFRPDHAAIGRGFLAIHRHGDDRKPYWTGVYVGRSNIVRVYRQIGFTRLDYACGGLLYMRSWDRWWGDRTISRLAKQMIADAEAGELQ